MEYREPTAMTRSAFSAAVLSDDGPRIAEALVGLVHNEPDGEWLQEVCSRLLDHRQPVVRAAGVTALGHVARLHRSLDQDQVRHRLEQLSQSEPELAGRIEDALDDIEMFGPPRAH